jgi:hypothetical protein
MCDHKQYELDCDHKQYELDCDHKQYELNLIINSMHYV